MWTDMLQYRPDRGLNTEKHISKAIDAKPHPRKGKDMMTETGMHPQREVGTATS